MSFFPASRHDRGAPARGRWVAALLVACVCLSWSASVEAQTAAERYAARAGKEAMAIARADGSSAQVAARFQVSMRRYASISQLVRFSLGPYRRDLPASRRSELYRLVERYAGRVFATYHGDFAGRSLEIVGSKPLGPRDTLVTTRIIHGGSRPPSEIEWRILRTGGRMRVFDMKVRGIWLTLLMRSTFVSILKQNRGDMDALFTYLKQ